MAKISRVAHVKATAAELRKPIEEAEVLLDSEAEDGNDNEGSSDSMSSLDKSDS
jgi:hypothetical protein